MNRLRAFVCALFVALPLWLSADTWTDANGVAWSYTVSNRKASVTGIPKDTAGALTIPSTLDGYPVTSIGDRAFYGCSSLTSVEIPEGVTYIGWYAFEGCSSLTSVEIPEDVTSIGGYAFQGCSALTSVTIPSSVTSIGNGAFRGCGSLTSVEIPSSVTSIGVWAFQDCSSLTSVTIPASVTSIGDAAFWGCSSLTSVVVPSSVTSIGNYVFVYCTSLTSVTIPEGVTSIGDSAFYGCSSLTSVTIPESVTSIGNSAFRRCSSLTSVTIPEGVTSIGGSAFYNCSSLSEIRFEGGVPQGDGNSDDLVDRALIGTYRVEYADLWAAALNSSGLWRGLTMRLRTSAITYINLREATHSNPEHYAEGSEYTFLPPTEVPGYTFLGWNPEAIDASMSGDQVVSASWKANSYVIAYNANGGTGEMAGTSATYGQVVALATNGFARAKYLFKGWALEPTGEVVYGDGAEVRNLTAEADGEVTLYAVWEKREILLRSAVAKQRFPWNGVVDIEVTLEDDGLLTEYSEDYAFRLRAIDQTSQEVYVPSAEALTLTVPTSGVQQLTWDVARDYPSLISRELSFTVEVVESEVSETQATYLIIDLSGGSEASTYSVTPLAAMPTEGWGEEYKTNKLVLRRITPGTFMMGSPNIELGRDSDETQHQVTLTQPYYIGVFEVTQRQWELVMGNRPSYFSNDAYYSMRPVECVSYNDICGSSLGAQWPSSDAVDASSFLGKLRARTGCEQWSLPTEAQWEYACRAGTTTALNSGKDLTSTTSCSNLDEVGRYQYNGGESYSVSSTTANGTATVGSYQPNGLGLYDMHGNVWEWCRDWFRRDLGTEAAIDPCGPTSGFSRALRGCCWSDPANGCRSAARDYLVTTHQDMRDGFRLVYTADLMAMQEEGEGLEAVVTSIQTATIVYDATVASRVIGASEVSALPYSPAWAGGDTVRITINGEVWHTDTQSGEKAWAPEETEYYLLLHETLKDGAVIETQTARVKGAQVNLVDTPTLTVREGNMVLVSTTTEGATLHYTVDGSEPTEQSPITPGLLSLSGSGTLKVLAMKDGWGPSEIVSYEHTSVVEGNNVKSLLRQESVPWQEVSLDGTQVWQSGAIGDGGASTMSLTLTGQGTLTFRWTVSSEGNYDWLSFRRDGILIQRISGTQDWQRVTYSKTDEAAATFTWQYTKDGSRYSGSDCGWVDEIMWRDAGPLQAACGLYDSDSQLYYSIANSTVTILSYAQLPEDGYLVIPAEIDGYLVTAIGDYAFTNCASLVSVTLPASVTTVGIDAFRGVAPETLVAAFVPSRMSTANLKTVTIPVGVTSIGSSAFRECSALTTVTIPASVTSIGDGAFSGVAPATLVAAAVPSGMSKTNLTSVVIPEGVTSIVDSAFRGCSALTSVTIPEGVTSIGDGAFEGCSALPSVVIPTSVTSIGDGAFRDCPRLTSVVIPEGVTSIGWSAFSGCSALTSVVIPEGVTSIGGYAFRDCSALTSVTIPEGVTSISSYVFQGCSALSSVVIPASVTSIGWYAFSGCSSLTSVVIPEGVTSIGDSAFAYCSSLTSVVIPASATSVGDGAFTGVAPATLVAAAVPSGMSKTNLTSVVIPEGVTSIGWGAFSGCSSLTSVVIPEGVTSIGNVAFSGCTALTSVEIPEGVTSIGGYAFRDCSALTSVVIPASVTSISNYVFQGCSALTSVVIPASVTSIGGYAFSGCSALTSVVIPEGVTSISNYVFAGCSALTSVKIPEGVTAIGDGAFYGCSSLTSVVIPASVTSISNYVFQGCSALTSVTIPASVTSIGDYAFQNCSSLTSVVIPEGVTAIGTEAFAGCSSLTSVVIPSSVTSIGDGAFYGCSSLTSVEIPDGVTSIGNDVFNGCSALTSVTIPSSVTSIGDYAFQGCGALTSVEIPASVTAIGRYAFAGCSSLPSVVIPASVTAIGYMAFDDVAPATLVATAVPSGMLKTNLTSVVIPEGVTSIGASAFKNCSALTSVTIPNSVTMIGANAFEGVAPEMLIASRFPAGSWMSAEKLTTVIVPEGTKSIAAKAFAGCSALTSVTIPSSVTEIDEGAFTDVALERLVAPFLPTGMSTAKLIEVTLTTAATVIAEEAFAGNTVLQSIVFPAGVTSIGARAFKGCSSLERATIPSSVTEIGAGAFKGCTGLSEVVFAEGLTKIGDEAFWGCSAVEEMVLPASVTELGGRAFTGCNRVLVAEGNRNYKSVDGVLFSANDMWLWHFPIGRGGEYATPMGVSFVGEEAFMGNTALTQVYLTDIVTIGPRAFQGCSALRSCFATEGLTTIEANAFESATSLGTFTVPASVTKLQTGAFANCPQLNSVVFRGGVPERTGTVFSGMDINQAEGRYLEAYSADWTAELNQGNGRVWDGLNMVLDSSRTATSGDYTYSIEGGEAIITGTITTLPNEVVLPMALDGYLVTGIGAQAFKSNTNLTAITFPRGLRSIGNYAFRFCKLLQSVTFEGHPLDADSVPLSPFPSNTTAIGSYPQELESVWRSALQSGYYYGLRMGKVEIEVVTFGKGSVLGCGTYYVGTSVTLEAVPAKGQRFVEWELLDEAGTTSTENPFTFTVDGAWVADGSFCLMATFEKNPDIVVFWDLTYENLMGATHTNPASYRDGSAYTFEPPSVVPGYTFLGWQPSSIDTSMAEDLVVRASWQVNNYTVNYHANGGEGAMENSSAVYDTPFTLRANAFTRSGYTFQGWATEPQGEVCYADGAEVSNLTGEADGTVTLYAVWLGNTYTIAYHANGGVGNSAVTEATYGRSVVLPANAFTRVGYTFQGWATAPQGEVLYADGAEVRDLTSVAGGTVTLYAVWKLNNYTIAYRANGGEGTMTATSATYGQPIALSANTFLREGYTFQGWSTEAEGPVVYADGAEVVNLTEQANQEVALYALWQANSYTIAYNANGGEGEMASTPATYDESLQLPASLFTRTGYTFAGWALEATGEEVYSDGAEVENLTAELNGTVTLYATWQANTYTIAYDANGGQGEMAGTLAEYNATVTLRENAFTRVGCAFVGWATEAEGTLRYRDGAEVHNLTAEADGTVTLYALWQTEEYTEGCFFYTLSEAGATLVEYDDEASGASAHVVVPNTLGGYPVIAIGLPGELGDDDYSGFSACHNVVTVTLPTTVTTIYDEAFANCSRLESVTIPASVTFLDDGASWGSPNLRYIVDPANACYASDEHGYLYNKERTVLMAAPTARGDFVVPDGVVEISECAFFYSRFNSITSVTLPASVRRVCDWAFRECYNLKSVHFKGEPLDYCGEWAFGDDFLSGTYLPEYQDVWQANLSNGIWQNLTMSLYLTEPTVEGDPDAVVETDENGRITVKPSGEVKDVVVSIPEEVEPEKVTVEVPSTATSVTANGATIKVVKVEGETRHDITAFLNIPAAVAGKIDLTQAEVKAEIAKAILDTSEAGGAVFDPSAKQPLTTAVTKPGLTYTLLEGDSLDNPKVGDSKVGDGQPWQPQVTKRGPSAFYRIRVSK